MGFFRRSHRHQQNIAELLSSDVKKDLHIHTYYSDGEFSPEVIVDRWHAQGYKIISITDHDGIEGSVIGMDYAAGIKGITLISGIEFDSFDEAGRDIHILGYGFDLFNHELREALTDILMIRARRNDRLMTALKNLGYNITIDDIGKINEGRYVGKPTFSTILSKKGYTSDKQEAFKTIFRDPSIREIHKDAYSSKKVIDLIHKAGGLAVFAHPMEQRHLNEPFEEFEPRLYHILERMREYGIDGIECRHPSANEYQTKLLEVYAHRHGLLITEGSDFHTDFSPRDFSRYTGM